MAKKGSAGKAINNPAAAAPAPTTAGRPSALLGTYVIYYGDNLERACHVKSAAAVVEIGRFYHIYGGRKSPIGRAV